MLDHSEKRKVLLSGANLSLLFLHEMHTIQNIIGFSIVITKDLTCSCVFIAFYITFGITFYFLEPTSLVVGVIWL
jgi:hypothetical protein